MLADAVGLLLGPHARSALQADARLLAEGIELARMGEAMVGSYLARKRKRK